MIVCRFSSVPTNLSDSDSEDKEDIEEGEKKKELEVEVQEPTTSPKKPSLEKSPTVKEENRTHSPKKEEEIQAKSRDCIAQEEELGSGETRDQKEQVGNVVLGDQEEQTRIVESRNLKKQSKNREREDPAEQLSNIQSSRYLDDDVMKRKTMELEKRLKNSKTKNEGAIEETEKRGTTSRNNARSKIQESEVEKQRQEGVHCAETSAESQRLNPAVECSQDSSSQSAMKQSIQECNNNKTADVSKTKKTVETSEISDKLSKQDDDIRASATHRKKPISMIEDTHHIGEEDTTLTKKTEDVASGQVTSLNEPRVSTKPEGELIPIHNLHESDKEDLREQEDDTTDISVSSPLPTILSADDIHNSVESPNHMVSVPADAFTKISLQSPSLLENTEAGTQLQQSKVISGELFSGVEENLCAENPEDERRIEVRIGTERELISQPCHSQSAGEETIEDKNSNELKDYACDVKASQTCNEDNQGSQQSSATDFIASAVSEDGTCTDLYESAQDTFQEGGHISPVKNSKQDVQPPSTDSFKAYSTDSDDSFTGVFFDIEEKSKEFTLVLHPSSSDNNSNTICASTSNKQDSTIIASSFQVEATGDVCDLPKETEKGCKDRILKEHQEEVQSSLLSEVLDRKLPSPDIPSSIVSDSEGASSIILAFNDEELVQNVRLPPTSEKKENGKGLPGCKNRYRRVHRSPSTSSTSSTEDKTKQEKVPPKRKRKVVERKKRGPPDRNENTSACESDPVQRSVPLGKQRHCSSSHILSVSE